MTTMGTTKIWTRELYLELFGELPEKDLNPGDVPELLTIINDISLKDDDPCPVIDLGKVRFLADIAPSARRMLPVIILKAYLGTKNGVGLSVEAISERLAEQLSVLVEPEEIHNTIMNSLSELYYTRATEINALYAQGYDSQEIEDYESHRSIEP